MKVQAALWKMFAAGAYLFGTDTEAAEQCVRDWERKVNGRRLASPSASKAGDRSVAWRREPFVRLSVWGCGVEDRHDPRRGR